MTSLVKYDERLDVTMQQNEQGQWVVTSGDPLARRADIGPYETRLPEHLPVQPLAPSAASMAQTQGSYQDRARGFQIATLPISVAFGVGVLIVAWVGASVPVFSLASLTVFWLAFLAWWLLGWLVHHLFSADGVALLHTLAGWQYLKREQRERHKRYKGR